MRHWDKSLMRRIRSWHFLAFLKTLAKPSLVVMKPRVGLNAVLG